MYPRPIIGLDVWYFVSYPIIGLMSDILYLILYVWCLIFCILSYYNVWCLIFCILSYYRFDVWYFVSYPIIGLMSDILYPDPIIGLMSDILYPILLIGLMSDILYPILYRFDVWYFVSYPIIGLMSLYILYPILL